MDYTSGEPITSSGYYQYHTKWVTTTCYKTLTKTGDCSYGGSSDAGGDLAEGNETVSPHVYPGTEYNDYKTVYETVYETASPYAYGTALPYPYEMVCHPETIYSTVYSDSSDIVSHTLTASGTDETVTGSPVYHTVDTTIMETLTASPSGGSGSGSGCSDGPWIVNPDFEDPTWPGAWLPSNSVHLSTPLAGSWSAELPVGAAAGGDPQLEQAIIIPSGRTFNIGFYYIPRNYGAGDFLASFSITVSLGSYDSQVFSFSGVPYWGYNMVLLSVFPWYSALRPP